MTNTHSRKPWPAAFCAVAMIIPAIAAQAADRTRLSESCEVAVARSALPSRLRAEASVYTPVNGNYELTVKGTGMFTCIVERNHRDSVIPQCVDRAGVDTVLPAIIERSEMILAGAEPAVVEAANQERLASGDHASPSRPGVNYMMSDYNYIYNERAGGLIKVPPHVMFYAPGIRNEDIGGSFQGMIENIGTPFVFQEGPHGYILTYAEHRADPNEVAAKCTGQLGEPPPAFDPFPKG